MKSSTVALAGDLIINPWYKKNDDIKYDCNGCQRRNISIFRKKKTEMEK